VACPSYATLQDYAERLPLVIARCSPESKVKMVQALHDRNKIVAMTGYAI
jgi:magnesium-transporting ATPase (P-type)